MDKLFLSINCILNSSFLKLNDELLNNILILLIITSSVIFLQQLYKILFPENQNSYSLNELRLHCQTQLQTFENMRKQLFIQTVRSNFLAMSYFAITENNEQFQSAKNKLKELGISQKILGDPEKFCDFFQKISLRQIQITFDQDKKKFNIDYSSLNQSKQCQTKEESQNSQNISDENNK